MTPKISLNDESKTLFGRAFVGLSTGLIKSHVKLHKLKWLKKPKSRGKNNEVEIVLWQEAEAKKKAFSEFIVLKKSKPFQRGNINRSIINIGNILIW